jgi:glycine hydroxymethyltransferase
MQPEFVDYQRSVLENASLLAYELQRRGLRIVSGGTDTHLVLVDLSALGISGRDAEQALEAAGILVNRNSIPFDPKPPQVTSGIRVGTPAATTRGFGAEEMKQLGSLIFQVLSSPYDQHVQEQTREEVREMCQRLPIPGIA